MREAIKVGFSQSNEGTEPFGSGLNRIAASPLSEKRQMNNNIISDDDTEEIKIHITWAAKVKTSIISRLSQTDALALIDEDLINDVGTALNWRCESIIIVTEANRVNCPRCHHQIRCPEKRWSRTCPILYPACG